MDRYLGNSHITIHDTFDVFSTFNIELDHQSDVKNLTIQFGKK